MRNHRLAVTEQSPGCAAQHGEHAVSNTRWGTAGRQLRAHKTRFMPILLFSHANNRKPTSAPPCAATTAHGTRRILDALGFSLP